MKNGGFQIFSVTHYTHDYNSVITLNPFNLLSSWEKIMSENEIKLIREYNALTEIHLESVKRAMRIENLYFWLCTGTTTTIATLSILLKIYG